MQQVVVTQCGRNQYGKQIFQTQIKILTLDWMKSTRHFLLSNSHSLIRKIIIFKLLYGIFSTVIKHFTIQPSESTKNLVSLLLNISHMSLKHAPKIAIKPVVIIYKRSYQNVPA